MISVRNLSARLGDFLLKEVSLDIGDGEYFVILGPTGAGKTVLIECLAGLHPLTSGEVWIGGRHVTS
jgi:ABC-type sugar transport system ATPase subunit